MSGIPEFNFPAFEEAARVLREQGVEVISPHEVNPPDGVERPWAWYLRRDLVALMEADAIVRLPGADASRGSRLECHVGAELGMDIFELADVLAAEAVS
jgi:hypothetical protein